MGFPQFLYVGNDLLPFLIKGLHELVAGIDSLGHVNLGHFLSGIVKTVKGACENVNMVQPEGVVFPTEHIPEFGYAGPVYFGGLGGFLKSVRIVSCRDIGQGFGDRYQGGVHFVSRDHVGNRFAGSLLGVLFDLVKKNH